jgi:hypothetical protein
VYLTCLHPNRENHTTRPHLNQRLAFALQEPAIVEHRRGRPAGSTDRIDNPTQRNSQHSSEILAALPQRGRGRRCVRRGNLQTSNRGSSTQSSSYSASQSIP